MKMYNLLSALIAAGCMALFALASPIMAADLTKADGPTIILEGEPAGFSWAGAYLGVQLGGGWADIQDVNNPAATKKDPSGVTIGATAGYNWQMDNNIVFGVEGDLAWANINKKWGGTNQFDPYYGEDGINALGTLRVRAGYAMDRFLPYVTAGLAAAQFEHRLGCDANRVVATRGCQNRVAAFDTKSTDWDFGYAVGAGAEYALSDRLSIKAEYLYMDFGKNSITLTDPNYPALSGRKFDSDLHTVKMGLNYRF